MEIKRKQVTPTTAKKWLSTMVDNNRSIKPRKVAQYADDMRSGRWQTGTGETIKFNTDGKLIDGQNRLNAVIDAQRTIIFDVAHDVPVEAMTVLDTGVSRSPADALRISGAGVTRPISITSLVRGALMWDHGNQMAHQAVWSPTHLMVIDRYREEAAAFDTAAARGRDCQRSGLGIESVSALAYYLFARHLGDDDQVHGWFDQLITGANLNAYSPALTLRNRALKFKADRINRSEQLALHIIAWNYYRADRECRVLKLPVNGLTNATFPKIDDDDGSHDQTLIGEVVRASQAPAGSRRPLRVA